MTNRQAAVLASRIFCVWFIYNAVINLAVLPSILASLQQGYVFSSLQQSYASRFERTMLMNALGDLLRLGINFAAAIFFYRCDAWLIGFLIGDPPDAQRTEANVSS